MRDLSPHLRELKAQDLYRSRVALEGPQGAQVRIDGRDYLAFCSNDYLGLANHPEVVRAFVTATDRYGVGSGAAHLVSGHSVEHHALEEELAEFTGRDRSLLFSTGYMANIGVMAALLGRRDVVCQDRLNHASLLDGGLLCRARLLRYAHGDVQALQQRLAALAGGEILVATDGVFSMDGDLAPLPGLVAMARQYRAWLMVDDAHGLGVLGRGGGGSLEALGVGARDVPILVGTLGKAFGTAGAFVAGNDDLIETLIHRARSYIYTTAMPAALAAATRTSLRLVRREGWRRDRLRMLVTRFRAGAAQLGLPLMESETQIQPLQIGDSATALALGKALRDRGILITAIRPPTVPAGTARLRVTFSAAHTEAHVDRLLGALDQVRIPATRS